MTKHQEYFNLMLDKNPELFKTFGDVHDLYVLDPVVNQTEFNDLGATVQDVVTDYQNRLCHHSEKSQYAKFSHHLSDKFMDLVRTRYPKYDDIGIEVTFLDQSPDEIVDDVLDDALNQLKKTTL